MEKYIPAYLFRTVLDYFFACEHFLICDCLYYILYFSQMQFEVK